MPHNLSAKEEAARRERALRMMAIEIVAKLPADQAEAQLVLGYSRELLDGFLFAREARQGPVKLTLCESAS